ncbi:MAG: patatin-like phospholipase family protein, partial [Vicinamibacteria bacterium]
RGVLENHGYALMDAAIRTHVPELVATDASLTLPFPGFAPPMMAEDGLRGLLAGSEKRTLTGRR